MLEKDVTPKILRAMRDDPQFKSALVEIKMARGKTLPKGAIAEHQRRNLTLAYFGAIYFKIPDLGFQNPADAFILKGSEAWLVIWFCLTKSAHEVWALLVPDIPPSGKITIDYCRKVGKRVNC